MTVHAITDADITDDVIAVVIMTDDDTVDDVM